MNERREGGADGLKLGLLDVFMVKMEEATAGIRHNIHDAGTMYNFTKVMLNA